jgi:hypothetical protein
MALAGTFDITVPCYNGHLGLGTQVTVISRGDCKCSTNFRSSYPSAFNPKECGRSGCCWHPKKTRFLGPDSYTTYSSLLQVVLHAYLRPTAGHALFLALCLDGTHNATSPIKRTQCATEQGFTAHSYRPSFAIDHALKANHPNTTKTLLFWNLTQ